jgi:uncharacterized RDD family membrane protein YckC
MDQQGYGVRAVAAAVGRQGVFSRESEPAGHAAGHASEDVGRRYAGVGRRCAATAIDSLVLVGVAIVVVRLFGTEAATVRQTPNGTMVSHARTLSGAGALLLPLAWFAYYVALETLAGATPGKWLCGLHVETVAGARPGLGAALVRTALRLVDGIGFYLVGAAVAWASPRRQRLGDRAARTVVVRR